MCIKSLLRHRSFRRAWIASLTWLAAWTVLGNAQTSNAQSMPDLAFGLRGRVRTTAGHGSEHLALVVVELIPPTSQGTGHSDVKVVEYDSELESAPGTDVPLDPLERDEVGSPADESSARSRGRDGHTKRRLSSKEIPFVMTPAFAQAAIQAALRAHGVMPALDRLDALSSRAKNSALLPEVRLRAGRDADHALRLSPTSDDPYRYSQSGGVSFVVEGAVTWRLGKLVFTGEELSIERLRLAQAREQQRITQVTLNELLVWQTAWRRTQALGDSAGHASEELFESTLRLDVLTGGWFSAHQPEQRQAEPAREGEGGKEQRVRRSERPSAALRSHPSRRSSDSRSEAASSSSCGRTPSPTLEQPIRASQKVEPTRPPQLEGLALSR